MHNKLYSKETIKDPKSVYHKSGNTQAALNIFKAFIKTLS